MIENLETLVTLSKTGTMMEASTAMRISQSAVSKRIAALERYYDRELIERHGRRVVLIHHGTRLVERVTPLLSELRSVFLEDNALRKGKIILGVSEAILASWGPHFFAQIRDRLPEVEFEFHAQRSPVVLDRLRSGEYGRHLYRQFRRGYGFGLGGDPPRTHGNYPIRIGAVEVQAR